MAFDGVCLLLPSRDHIEQRVHLAELSPDRQQRAAHTLAEVTLVVTGGRTRLLADSGSAAESRITADLTGAELTTGSNQHLKSLSLARGARATVGAPSTVLAVQSLAIDDQSTIDLGTGALVVRASSASQKDQYLARLHQAATRRFHTDDYERSVLRKVETLESIYAKIRDSQAQLRAEILEWIIIALIAFEVVMSFVR